MNFENIKEIIRMFGESHINELEIKQEGTKIRLKKEIQYHSKKVFIEEKSFEIESKDDLYIVKAPLVGVFYSAESPGSEPYVKVGDQIEKNSPLCILEAMKIMNEIESEFSGEVVEILVENETLVEFQQPIMKIRRKENV